MPLLISLCVDDDVQHRGHPDGLTIFTQVAGKQSRVDVIGGRVPVQVRRKRKRMIIAASRSIGRTIPVNKFDRSLERSTAVPDEILLVQSG